MTSSISQFRSSLAVGLLLASSAATVRVVAGWSGFAHLFLFALAALPGLPLGFALFGRRHAAGWLAGILLGYAITTCAVWAVVFLGLASPLLFLLSWAAAALAIWAATFRLSAPLISLPLWSARDTTALLLLLLLVPALVAGPFARLGAEDKEGSRQYRAYFIADFIWHTALTAELAKQAPRPANPFLAQEPLHYYWTYFRLPATITAEAGSDVQRALKVNAFATALLLLASIYLAAWSALPASPVIVAIAVALTVVAPSAEGLAGIADVVRRGLPLSELRDVNIDAAAAWAFKGLRIDNLPRTMWYTPQHGFSCALGLLAVPVAITAGLRARRAAIFVAGCALGASLAFNPLLGAAFCGVYGLTVLADMRATGGSIRDLARHALAIVPVGLALGWCQLNAVGEGAGAALHFGFWGLARNQTVLTFLLQFGAILVPIAAAFWPGVTSRWSPLVPALAGVGLSILVMHLVSLTVDPAWVGFRGGNLFFVLAPALVAAPLARLWDRGSRRAVRVIVALVAAIGLPTTIIDAYNAQDVENRGLSRDAERARGVAIRFDPDAEFHWTMVVTRDELEALAWVRDHTAPTAVVQFEPTVRGRETWGLVPALAERRMATGNALALLAVPAYGERNARVRAMYASTDGRSAWQEGRALGIDYIFEGPLERTSYPAAVFDRAPDYFTPVFRNAQAAVYALRP